MNVQLAIRSIGPPPERHADRVIMEMTRWLIVTRIAMWKDIRKIMRSTPCGNPKSQLKMGERLKAIGGNFFFHVGVTPGKRGRYELSVIELRGYDQSLHITIDDVDSAIPPKPWLVCFSTTITSLGRYRFDTKKARLLLITHHAMSRLAVRCEAKTTDDLVAAIWAIFRSFTVAFDAAATMDNHRLKFKLPDATCAVAVICVTAEGLNFVATVLPEDAA